MDHFSATRAFLACIVLGVWLTSLLWAWYLVESTLQRRPSPLVIAIVVAIPNSFIVSVLWMWVIGRLA